MDVQITRLEDDIIELSFWDNNQNVLACFNTQEWSNFLGKAKALKDNDTIVIDNIAAVITLTGLIGATPCGTIIEIGRHNGNLKSTVVLQQWSRFLKLATDFDLKDPQAYGKIEL